MSLGKDIVSLCRDAFLLVVAMMLVGCPRSVNTMLVNAGFEEGSVAGFKWKARFSETDKSLVEARNEIAELRAANDKLVKNLSAPNVQITPDIKKDVDSLEQTSARAAKVGDELDKTISNNAPYVQQIQGAVDGNAAWAVVLSADATLDGAKYEVGTAAPKAGISDAFVCLRHGSYRVVVRAPDRIQAQQLVARAKANGPQTTSSGWARYADAYIVNFATWCPVRQERDGFTECQGSGTD